MLGINPNGLKSPGRLKFILKMAARNSIDILFIQEHNFKKKSKSTFELAARYAGYAACVGYLPEGEVKGGSAILVRRSTFGLGHTHLDSSSHLLPPPLRG